MTLEDLSGSHSLFKGGSKLSNNSSTCPITLSARISRVQMNKTDIEEPEVAAIHKAHLPYLGSSHIWGNIYKLAPGMEGETYVFSTHFIN